MALPISILLLNYLALPYLSFLVGRRYHSLPGLGDARPPPDLVLRVVTLVQIEDFFGSCGALKGE